MKRQVTIPEEEILKVTDDLLKVIGKERNYYLAKERFSRTCYIGFFVENPEFFYTKLRDLIDNPELSKDQEWRMNFFKEIVKASQVEDDFQDFMLEEFLKCAEVILDQPITNEDLGNIVEVVKSMYGTVYKELTRYITGYLGSIWREKNGDEDATFKILYMTIYPKPK